MVDGLPASRVNASRRGRPVARRDATTSTAAPRCTSRRPWSTAIASTHSRPKATIVDSRVQLDADARAYGAHATAKGEIVAAAERPRAGGRAGRARSPASTCASCRGAWACRRWRRRPVGSYRARLDERGPSGELVFDASTVEGASIDAGTRVSGTLYGSRPTFTAKGGIRDVDPHRFGTRAAAAGPDRGAPARPDRRHLRRRGQRPHVPTLELAGAARRAARRRRRRRGARRGRRRPPDARRLGRHARARRSPTSIRALPPTARRSPAPSADRIDAAMATPSITAFSLPDTTGRVSLTLAARRGSATHAIDRGDAAGVAGWRRPRRRVARRRRPARRRDREGARSP